jgi:hypothetical protein
MPESLFAGWVNITGMVGQHKTEWWVNMLRNLQLCRFFYPFVLFFFLDEKEPKNQDCITV